MKNPCPYSWKKCTFAAVFFEYIFLLLNFSAELRPRTRFYEQDQISIGAVHYSAVSTIADLRLSQAWLRIWDGACAFFMPLR